jgi:hypothetical protein
MKNLFTIALFMLSTVSFSQALPPSTLPLGSSRIPEETAKATKTVTETEDSKSNWGKYVSFSASISSQEGVSTLESSYYTIEAGVCYKNISGGLGFGKNFQGDPSTNNWFVEPRFVWNVVDLTAFKAGIIGGFGTYLAPDKPLIREYGVGTELDSDYVNYTLQFTNWGTSSSNANYVSIGISKSF